MRRKSKRRALINFFQIVSLFSIAQFVLPPIFVSGDFDPLFGGDENSKFFIQKS
jgi:hypothetical protein